MIKNSNSSEKYLRNSKVNVLVMYFCLFMCLGPTLCKRQKEFTDGDGDRRSQSLGIGSCTERSDKTGNLSHNKFVIQTLGDRR